MFSDVWPILLSFLALLSWELLTQIYWLSQRIPKCLSLQLSGKNSSKYIFIFNFYNMHLFSPDELKLKIREMWMYLFSWDWASFISLVMLVWCHIISYTSNIFFSLLIGKMSENPDTWFENYILDVTEEPMKGELYTYFDGIYFLLCMSHLSCNRSFYFTFVLI